MSKHVGTAKAVGELIEMLQQLPPEKPIRTQTLSHEWPVEVREHERCVTVGA